MADNNGQNQSWWSTLPGTITAIAALITAIGGLIVILSSNGFFKNKNNSADTVFVPKRDTPSLTPAERLRLKQQHRAL